MTASDDFAQECATWSDSHLLAQYEAGPRAYADPDLRQVIRAEVVRRRLTKRGVDGLGVPPDSAEQAVTAVTVAEHAFLALAREWQAGVENAPEGRAWPRAVDVQAHSCLLLAVEWGKEFTDVARHQMEINIVAAAARRHGYLSMDVLPWKLCQSSFLVSPPESEAVQYLTRNLDHPDSSIRLWLMELGWFAFPWLRSDAAAVRLLKNLADTLAGYFMAAGLAARFFDKEEGFTDFARSFKPPGSFGEQYQDRLKYVEEHGILAMQAPFWRLESECRTAIERASLGFRIPKASERATSPVPPAEPPSTDSTPPSLPNSSPQDWLRMGQEALRYLRSVLGPRSPNVTPGAWDPTDSEAAVCAETPPPPPARRGLATRRWPWRFAEARWPLVANVAGLGLILWVNAQMVKYLVGSVGVRRLLLAACLAIVGLLLVGAWRRWRPIEGVLALAYFAASCLLAFGHATLQPPSGEGVVFWIGFAAPTVTVCVLAVYFCARVSRPRGATGQLSGGPTELGTPFGTVVIWGATLVGIAAVVALVLSCVGLLPIAPLKSPLGRAVLRVLGGEREIANLSVREVSRRIADLQLMGPGVKRLSNEALRAHAVLHGRFLGVMDERTCAATARGLAGASSIASALNRLDSASLEAYLRIGLEAREAQRQLTPFETVYPDQASRAWDAVSRRMTPAEWRRVAAVRDSPETAADSDACAAIRTIYRVAPTMDDPERRHLLRLMVIR